VSSHPDFYTVTGAADGGSVITPSGSSLVARGGSISFEFSAKPGYVISRVLVDGSPIDFSSGRHVFSNVGSNHVIAVFSDDGSGTLRLTVDVTGGDGYPKYSVDSAPYSRLNRSVALSPGSDLGVSIDVADGYRLVGWKGDVEQSGAEVRISDVRSDVYLIAVLEPVGGGDGAGDGNWAAVNIILAVLATLTAAFVLYARKGFVEKDGERRSKAALALRVVALAVAVASIAVFFLTEDLSRNIGVFDEWTPLTAVLLAVVLALVAVSARLDRRPED
ncbi:MAG: hypothetical protein LBS92_04005, partial [Candidatus Methanoplasma sp.]|nr:hypothetical protein [Candidatus Methanoplasma sp.]